MREQLRMYIHDYMTQHVGGITSLFLLISTDIIVNKWILRGVFTFNEQTSKRWYLLNEQDEQNIIWDA